LTPADEQPAWQQSLVSKGSSATDQKDVGSVSSLIDGLAERLQSEPDDADGWLLLAKSYKHLGRMDDARSAYERAEILGQSDPAFATSLNDEPNGESGAAETSSAPEIRGRVSLAAQAADSVNSSDTVFVIAKAVDGSPMPLAVIKKPASELPFEFVLNDSASLVKGLSISSASKIIVTAKISPSGDALQPAAGLEATSGAISANETEYLELEINPDANPGNK
jgi:cytochrome c-type biogenesis protein CcmH